MPLRTSSGATLQQRPSGDVNSPPQLAFYSEEDSGTRDFCSESVNRSHTPSVQDARPPPPPDSTMDLDPGRDPPLSALRARENDTIETQQDDAAWTDAPRLSDGSDDDGGGGMADLADMADMADDKAGGSDAEMSFLLGGSCSISPQQQSGVQPGAGAGPRPSAAPASTPRKVTFCMGFRADCEKCQQRVPGHYSHILRS